MSENNCTKDISIYVNPFACFQNVWLPWKQYLSLHSDWFILVCGLYSTRE